MNESFKQRFDKIIGTFDRLRNAEPFSLPLGRQPIPMQGIYLFSSGQEHFYVGRSDNIRRRLGLHTRPGSVYGQATFATILAKETCGLKATYRIRKNDPNHFSNQKAFLDAFSDAKARVKRMQIRVVEESDPINQALLEVYAAVVLPTKYNDFRNH